jgi:phage tail sheath gpL-like
MNDATSLAALKTHLDTVSGPMEQRPGIGIFAFSGTYSNAVTLASGVNSGRIACPFLRSTRSLNLELAAAFASVVAFEEDPARPLNTLELTGIHAPAIGSRFTRTEQENCLYNGLTPIEVGPSGAPQIVRAVTTYTKDANSVADVSLLDLTTIRTLDYVRKACRERIAQRFPREKLYAETIKSVRSELYDVLLRLEDLAIVENVEANKDGLVVERSGTDSNRLDAKIPADVVNGLHVFAGRIDLIL